MLRKMKKGFCGILSVAVMLILMSGVCYANDGMPVLQFDHDTYIGSPNSVITVGANVTDPDNSKPMKGVKVTFTLKDCNGSKTSLDTQKSGGDGTVSCDVPLGDAFPYTLIGSASDGVNLSKVKIKKSEDDPEPAIEEPAAPTDDESSDGISDEEQALAIAAADAAEKQHAKNEEKSMIGSFTLLIITLITVALLAVVAIIIIVKRNKDKKNNKEAEDKNTDSKKE